MVARPMWLLVPFAFACTPKAPPEAAAERPVRVSGDEERRAEARSDRDEQQVAEGEGASPLDAMTDSDANGELWSVVRTEDYAVAVPDGWHDVAPPADNVVLLRVGDGIGIPPIDEHGEPLQAGMIVERREGEFENAEQITNLLLSELTDDPAAELIGEPVRTEIALCDDTPAEFVAVAFNRPAERRKAVFTQVFAIDEAKDGWVASGYLVSGPDSAVTDMESLATTWLASHVLSFCPEPTNFDVAGVRAAYNALEAAMAAAEEDLRDEDADGVRRTGTERDVEPVEPVE